MIIYHKKKKSSNGWIDHTFLGIEKYGVYFSYKGDEVIWIWPWLRNRCNNGKKFFVITMDISFNSLKEIDNYWKEAEEYCNGS